MDSLYSLESEAFSSLVLYGSLALAKTVAMSMITGQFRKKTDSFATIEDARLRFPKDTEKQKELLRPNEDVERVRRAHLNDLENVVPFVVLGLLYIGTNPNPATALWHFRVFLACRVLHSIAYINAIRQPARAIGFLGGMAVFLSMALQTVAATYEYF